MEVTVVRGAGDKQADDIVNNLCAATMAGKEKGRNFLDENGFDSKDYEFSLPWTDLPRPGKICEVADASIGATFKGKITGWSISVKKMTDKTPVTIRCSLTVRKKL